MNNTFTQRIESIKQNALRLELASGTVSADCRAMLGNAGKASPFELTASVNAQIDAWGVETSKIFSSNINPKVTKRFIQFAHGISARSFKNIDLTTARILYAMNLAGDYKLTTDALAYLVTGRVGADRVAPESRGVSLRVIGKLFGKVGLTTAPTQISRSVGENGFLTLTGAVCPGKGQNRDHALVAHHPMVRAFFACIEAATDGQLDELASKGKSE